MSAPLRRGLVATTTALIAIATAPAAEAAYYQTSREGFAISVSVKPRQITKVTMKYRMHCDRRPNARGGNAFIWPHGIGVRWSGRFRLHDHHEGSQAELTLAGRVGDERLWGRYSLVHRSADGCRTGRSDSDPWIRFVARRQPFHVPSWWP